MILCSVDHVSQNYAGKEIFEDIQFEIKENDRVGLVGRNGSGKTTLIKLLAHAEDPSKGSLHWKKGLSIGYLKQLPDYSAGTLVHDVLRSVFASLLKKETEMKKLEEKMSQEMGEKQLSLIMSEYGKLLEEFMHGGGYEIEASIQQVAQGLGIQDLLDQEYTLLSGGEQTKIGLALNLIKKPDLLLLDEPTNHLDFQAIEWLEDFLSDYTGAVVAISHDRYFLDETATKIIDLEDGECTVYHTNFSGYIKEKEEKIMREFQRYEEQQRKIKKMQERAKTLREWADRAKPPNPGLHKKARHMERMIERMKKVKRPYVSKKMGLAMESADRSGTDVILTEQLAKSFDDKLLFKEAELHVRYQEHVALVGENGSGKSTLLKIILGKIKPDKGQVRLGNNVNIGYLSQHIFSTGRNERLIDVFREEVPVAEGQARGILANFLFYGSDVFQKVSKLSGGERMRLRLAQLMHQKINFLVLDEPTNHLDIESREVLEETLENFDGTILAVSHDRYFLDQLFNKIYWIEDKEVYEFPGNYSWAKQKMNRNR